MFTVDVELVNGTKRSPQFLTQQEAVAYAGRMAQDSAVKLSAVRGLDAKDKYFASVWFGGPSSSQGGSYVFQDYIEASSEEDASRKAKAETLRRKPHLKGNGKLTVSVRKSA